jgi:hypothetical protein
MWSYCGHPNCGFERQQRRTLTFGVRGRAEVRRPKAVIAIGVCQLVARGDSLCCIRASPFPVAATAHCTFPLPRTIYAVDSSPEGPARCCASFCASSSAARDADDRRRQVPAVDRLRSERRSGVDSLTALSRSLESSRSPWQA